MNTKRLIITNCLALGLVTASSLTALAGTKSGQTTSSVEGAARISISNPNGNVTVTAVDSATLRVTVTDTSTGEQTTLPADAFASSGSGPIDIRPPSRTTRGHEVTLEVGVPRDAQVGSVFAGSGNVTVRGVTSAMRITCNSGDVQAIGVGSSQIKAGSGDVLVENAGGSVVVEAGSGSVTARGIKGDLLVRSGSGDVRAEQLGGLCDVAANSGEVIIAGVTGDVHVAAISGDVHVDRASGSVEVGNASGSVYLNVVDGDVDVRCASGDAIFTGVLSRDHRYRLKSMSGDAVVHICNTPSGFTATMASYSGDIETAFPLSVDGAGGPVSRKIVGRYGDGSTQIQIEAFSGSAKLLKCQSGQ